MPSPLWTLNNGGWVWNEISFVCVLCPPRGFAQKVHIVYASRFLLVDILRPRIMILRRMQFRCFMLVIVLRLFKIRNPSCFYILPHFDDPLELFNLGRSPYSRHLHHLHLCIWPPRVRMRLRFRKIRISETFFKVLLWLLWLNFSQNQIFLPSRFSGMWWRHHDVTSFVIKNYPKSIFDAFIGFCSIWAF